VASIERALRRLRARGQRDGGVWGQRLLRRFGVPQAVGARMRWMGLYHSPFADLPLSLCLDQLRLWDRPPVAETPARVWIALGQASCALRQRQREAAAQHCEQAAAALRAGAAELNAAAIELALVRAFIASRIGAAPEVNARLDEAAQLLAAAQDPGAAAPLAAGDAACFRARLVDQRAFQLNHAGNAEAEAQAWAMYRALPVEDVHPFASYRRDAGLAWGLARAGQVDEALRVARRATEHAGDGGYTRLRAMGLLLQAKIAGSTDAGCTALLARARGIAERLEDEELLRRIKGLTPAAR
jgi:hypothetical protein